MSSVPLESAVPVVGASPVVAVATKTVGFLEEAPGLKSSTRLFTACMVSLAVGIVITEIVLESLALTHSKPEPSFTGLNVALALVLGKGAVDVFQRTRSSGGDG